MSEELYCRRQLSPHLMHAVHLVVLNRVSKSPNFRQLQLDLISRSQRLPAALWASTSYSRRRSSHDDRSSRQGGPLRQESNNRRYL